jgi:hypothetical protein
MKSTKRWYGIIVLLVIGALILSSMSLIFTNQSFKQKWKWYENKEAGFKIKYPTAWEVFESNKENITPSIRNLPIGHAVAAPKKIFFYPSKLQINLSKPALEGAEIGFFIIQSVPTSKPPKETKEEISKNSKEKKVSIYERKDGIKVQHDSVIKEYEDIAYWINFWAPLDEFDKWNETFQQMLDSFKFI